MTDLDASHARQAIIEHTRRLAESAVALGPDAAVQTTPGWTVTDLVAHLGQTEHWVAEIIERRITDPTELPTEMAALPPDPGDWATWLSTSAQRVADACTDDALTAAVFNAAGDERSGTQFWLASVLNEAVVHGFDAANAAGRPAEIDADVASALISNHLAMLTAPTWEIQRPESARALRGTGQTLQLLATETADTTGEERAWFIHREPDGVAWERAIRPADVTVTGPAPSLLLILTRRLPATVNETAGITIEGDIRLVQHWLDNTAHVSD